jgi:hypothetical protein
VTTPGPAHRPAPLSLVRQALTDLELLYPGFMRRHLSRAVPLLLLLGAGLPACTPFADSPERYREEEAVYAVVLQDLAHPPEVTVFVEPRIVDGLDPLEDASAGGRRRNRQFLRQRLPAASSETIRDFARVNGHARPLPELGPGFPVLTEGRSSRADSLPEEPRRAREGHEIAVVRLSRVGFDADRTRALVYRGQVCGPLCGSGGYVLLEKRSGAWRIVDEAHLWIS